MTNRLGFSAISVLIFAGAASAIILLFLYIDAIRQGPILPDTPETSQITSEQSSTVADIVARVNPAVVAITVIEEATVEDDITPAIPELPERGPGEREISGGTGFLITHNGFIVTNVHVLDPEGSKYAVTLENGREYQAEVMARDHATDIALLKINALNLPYLEFGDSNQIRLGQEVIAIGNALGEFKNTVSTGVVSGISRSILAGDGVSSPDMLDDVIQTDASIHPGHSGGPLLDMNGRVIGVNIAIIVGVGNIGFALPSNTVRNSIQTIIDTGNL